MEENYADAEGCLQVQIVTDLRTHAWGEIYNEEIKKYPSIDPADWEWYRTDLNSDWGGDCISILFTLKHPHDDRKIKKLTRSMKRTEGLFSTDKVCYDGDPIDLKGCMKITNIRLVVPITTTA